MLLLLIIKIDFEEIDVGEMQQNASHVRVKKHKVQVG